MYEQSESKKIKKDNGISFFLLDILYEAYTLKQKPHDFLIDNFHDLKDNVKTKDSVNSAGRND